MNKIRIWKLALLITVTFGIYGLYWFARTRNELNGTYKLKLPHWAWLVVPLVLATVLILPAVILVMVGGLILDISSSDIALLSYVIPLAIIVPPLLISLWWIWKFAKGVNIATNGRVPAGWTLALYIFIGPYVALPHQYYLNRTDVSSKKEVRPAGKPSRKFIMYASIAIAVSCGLSIASFSSFPDDFKAMEQSVNDFDAYNKRIEDYSVKYKTCMDNLDKDYPVVTEEKEAKYLQGYEACEQIRLEQEAFIKDVDQIGK